MGLSTPVWKSIGIFFLALTWNLLFLLPLEFDGDNLIARIFVTVAISVSLALMLYRNIKMYIWKVFHRSKTDDDSEYNVFAFIWAHTALGACWGTFNLVLWTWDAGWFANVATVPYTNTYAVWLAFFYGSVAMLPGSTPVYIVTPTAPLTWAISSVQLLINWTFYLCGFCLFIAIFRKWLLTTQEAQKVTPINRGKSLLKL